MNVGWPLCPLTQNYQFCKLVLDNHFLQKDPNFTRNSLKLSFFPRDFEGVKSLKDCEQRKGSQAIVCGRISRQRVAVLQSTLACERGRQLQTPNPKTMKATQKWLKVTLGGSTWSWPKRDTRVTSLVDVSNIFYLFSVRGRGRGSPRRQEGAGVGFYWKSQEGVGGFPRERGGGGGGGCLRGNLGGGELNIFFGARNAHQASGS